MTVPVDGEIGEETHTVDQHLVFTSGMGKAVVAGEEQDVKAGDLVIVPAGTKHNFINMSPTPLILYTGKFCRFERSFYRFGELTAYGFWI